MNLQSRFNWQSIQSLTGIQQWCALGTESDWSGQFEAPAGIQCVHVPQWTSTKSLGKSKGPKAVLLRGQTAVKDTAGLTAAVGLLGATDALLMDEAWLFLDEQFQAGRCPEPLQRGDRGALQSAVEGVSGTHGVVRSLADRGYVLVVPKAWLNDLSKWFYLLPQDPNPRTLQLHANVPGVTSISILRRVHDARFATRFFKGFGIDVGGGNDSLALFLEFFPLVRNLIVYEREQGDGQLLENVPDNAFDFLYSSHCLEHLVNPHIALGNWLRVVKPGGHLVFQIPDEDLYEQGVWPSRFNTDHKHTFTIAKERSWSPVSVNVLDMVSAFRGQCKVLSIAQVDQGVRTRLLGSNVDQTRFPMAECGIEVILQKVAV